MIYSNNHTYIGYSHLNANKVCQDYSLSYKDNERAVIAVADGHGGDIYIRSEYGAKYACLSAMDVFRSLTINNIKKIDSEKLEAKIKLDVLCKWNEYVENHFASKHFRKSELSKLNDDQIFSLKSNIVKAYGTTLCGAMVLGRYLIVVSLGDTDIFGVKKEKLIPMFDTSEDPTANVTNSLCQDDAFEYLRVRICLAKEFDSVLICSDGLSSPYQDYKNFNRSFVQPACKEIEKLHGDYQTAIKVQKIASELGVGDDVSFAILQKI